MEYKKIIVSEADGIVRISLNRPKSLNALTNELIGEVHQVLGKAGNDPSVRCVVLSGEGRAFCAGDDLKGMGNLSPTFPETDRGIEMTGYLRLVKALRYLPKPVVAKVHGYCLGAGLEISLAGDFRVAAEGTKFGAVLITKAMVGGTYLLPKFVGMGRATDLIFTGRLFDAEEALSLGLITKVVPEDKLDEATDELVNAIAQGPTKSIGIAKAAINRSFDQGWELGLEYQAIALRTSQLTGDFLEGMNAFYQKRDPKFKGN